MFVYKLPNANASVIAVTSTATLLKNLINTAASTTATFPGDITAVDLIIEDGDVRMFSDGNTPTASKGVLLKQGTTYRFRGIDFHNIRLIRTGSTNVAVSVQIGYTDGGDLQDSSAGGGSSSGSTTGAAADNAAASGNPVLVAGKYNSSAPTYDNGDAATLQTDVNGNLKVTSATLHAGEDLTNNKQVVEHQYTPSGVLTSDTQVKGSAGFIHTVTFSCNDAAPTAGSIIIYNNTAESGTQIFNHTFTTTPFAPFTVTLDMVCSAGIYVGFTTTADVNVSVSYR